MKELPTLADVKMKGTKNDETNKTSSDLTPVF